MDGNKNLSSVFVFDIDGTISEQGKPVDHVIAQTIKNISQRHRVIFASARPVRDILPLLPDDLHNSLIIGCNGGMAWYQGKFLRNDKFCNKNIGIIVDYLDQVGAAYVLDGSWKYSFSPVPHPFHDYIKTLSDHEGSYQELIKEQVGKVLVFDVSLKNALIMFLERSGIQHTINKHKNDACFDITPEETDKYLPNYH